ncbi:hypothetical protein ACFFRR_009714 [Megaselia abdita]
MKPFTKIIYFHNQTPKVLKRRLHHILFYGNTACIKYKYNEQYVKAEFQNPYDIAKILRRTDREYLSIRLFKDANYHSYYKNYVKVFKTRKQTSINNIITNNNGQIIKETRNYTTARFQDFFTAAKVMNLFDMNGIESNFVEKETIREIYNTLILKEIIENNKMKYQ